MNILSRAKLIASQMLANASTRLRGKGLVTQSWDELLPLLEAAGYDGRGFPILDETPSTLSRKQALRQLLGYQYGAMKVFSGKIVGTPFHVQTKRPNDKTGKPQWQDDEDHELNALLDEVNPFLTWPELIQLTAEFAFAVGSAFWWLEKSGGRVVGIWPLDATKLKPRVNTTTRDIPSRFLSGWTYSMIVNKAPVKVDLEIDEIVHFPDPCPSDMRVGLGRVQAAGSGVNLLAQIASAQQHTLNNMLVPSMLIKMKSLGTRAKTKEALDALEQKLKGAKEAGRLLALVLDNMDDAECQMLEKGKVAEMGFKDSGDIARDATLAPTGVGQALLGVTRETARANVEGAEYIFASYHVQPWLVKFDARIKQDLCKRHFDDNVRIVHDSAVPAERELDLKEIETRLKHGDTWNSIAAERGWPEHDWGNVWYKPVGLEPVTQVPIDDAGNEDKQQLSQLIGMLKTLQLGPRQREIASSLAASISIGNHSFRSTSAAKGSNGKSVMTVAIPVTQAPRGFNREQRRRIESKVIKVRKPFEAAFARSMAIWFRKLGREFLKAWDAEFANQDQDKVLQGIVKQETNADIDRIIDSALNPERTAVELSKRTKPFLNRGMVLGGEFTRQLYDASLPEFSLEMPAAQKYAQQWNLEWAEGITRTNQREIKELVYKDITAKKTLREIREHLDDRLESWATGLSGRSMLIARTESTKMFAAGAQSAMEAYEVLYKQWVTSFVNSRDPHMSADGQVRKIQERFSVGGEEMLYPGRGSNPGNNCNCHCIHVAVPSARG